MGHNVQNVTGFGIDYRQSMDFVVNKDFDAIQKTEETILFIFFASAIN